MTEGILPSVEVRDLRAYTTRQLAQLLGISVKTLQKWRLERRGPEFRRISSRMVLYREADVADWLDVHRPRRGAIR